MRGRYVQVNWRAVHFKQPGKLNKMLPWEEFEMEKALAEEAERQASGQGRQSRECAQHRGTGDRGAGQGAGPGQQAAPGRQSRECTQHREGPQGAHGTHVLHERPGLRGWW